MFCNVHVAFDVVNQFSTISIMQFLLCKSSTLGLLVQYHSDGFLPSIRHHRAMGLAILEVAQAAHKNWKAGRSSKTNHKKATWREMFDVAVKWRRQGGTTHKSAKLLYCMKFSRQLNFAILEGRYSRSSLSGHSRKTALLTAALTNPRLNSSSYKISRDS